MTISTASSRATRAVLAALAGTTLLSLRGAGPGGAGSFSVGRYELLAVTGAFLPVAIPHAWFMGWTQGGDAFSYLKFVGEPGAPSYFVGNEPRLHRLDGQGADTILARRGQGGIDAKPEQFLAVLFDPDSRNALAIVRDGRSEIAVYRADAAARAGYGDDLARQ